MSFVSSTCIFLFCNLEALAGLIELRLQLCDLLLQQLLLVSISSQLEFVSFLKSLAELLVQHCIFPQFPQFLILLLQAFCFLKCRRD